MSRTGFQFGKRNINAIPQQTSPNIFIGGMSGRMTKTQFAEKIDLTEDYITYWEEVGDDIHAGIGTNYILTQQIGSGNFLTFYDDEGGKCTELKTNIFNNEDGLKFLNFPNVTKVGTGACTSANFLFLLNFPKLQTIGLDAFTYAGNSANPLFYVNKIFDNGDGTSNNSELQKYDAYANTTLVYVQNETAPDKITSFNILPTTSGYQAEITPPNSVNNISHYEMYINGILNRYIYINGGIAIDTMFENPLEVYSVGIESGTSNDIQIVAVDEYNNKSIKSDIVTYTTQTINKPVINNIDETASRSLKIETVLSNNFYPIYYIDVFVNGSLNVSGSTDINELNAANLLPSTNYNIEIQIKDNINTSLKSDIYNATTTSVANSEFDTVGLVSVYNAADESGTVFTDDYGVNDGVYVGTNNNFKQSLLGASAHLTSNWVDLQTQDLLVGKNNFTFGFWHKTMSIGNYVAWFGDYNSGRTLWIRQAGNLTVQIYVLQNNIFTSVGVVTNAFELGKNHLFLSTFENGTFNFYIDNVLKMSKTGIANLSSDSMSLRFNNGRNKRANFYLSQAYFYDKTFTQAERDYMWNNGKGRNF